MQKNYKLNGFSINEFASLTKIAAHNIYRYLTEEQGNEKEALRKAFNHKYGNEGSRYKAFQDYYLVKFIQIRHLKVGASEFWDLKKEFNDSADVFKLRKSRVDDIWDEIMNSAYLALDNMNDLTAQQRLSY